MPPYWAAAWSASTPNTTSGDTNRGRPIADRRATSYWPRATDRRPVDKATPTGHRSGDRATPMLRGRDHGSPRPTNDDLGHGPTIGFPDRVRASSAHSENPAGKLP